MTICLDRLERRMGMTLYEIVKKAASKVPKDVAYEYFDYERTYEDFIEDIDKMAYVLSVYGISKADKVGICMVNSPKLLTLLYAVNKIGAVAVMLNPKSKGKELYTELTMTDCAILFFSDVAIKNIYEYAILAQQNKIIPVIKIDTKENLPIMFKLGIMKKLYPFSWNSRIISCIGREYYYSYKDFFEKYNTLVIENADNRYNVHNASAKQDNNVNEYDDKEPAIILFSGGTTGEIKAIVHSSDSFNQSAKYCLKTEEPLPDKITMLAILPAFHIFGLSVAIHLPFVAMGKVILMPFFHADTLCRRFIKEAPSFMPGVPTVFERMLKNDIFKKAAMNHTINAKSFKHGFVGGDHLTEEVRNEFNNILRENGSDGYISMGYGMTECCPIAVCDRDIDEEACIGYAFPGNIIKICTPGTDIELEDGEKGEICVISPAMMLYAYTEKGRIIKPYGENVKMLHTEDIGYIRDGRIYFECRIRRIIKVSGHTIFATAVESVIDINENVEKAYVVPVYHSERGQGVFAYIVVKKSDGEAKYRHIREDISRMCKEELIPYAVPVGYRFIEEKDVPKTSLMKIAWGELEKMAALEY